MLRLLTGISTFPVYSPSFFFFFFFFFRNAVPTFYCFDITVMVDCAYFLFFIFFPFLTY